MLMQDDCLEKFQSKFGRANLLDFIVRRTREFMRSIVFAELNGPVDLVEA